jgi:hypothetical protein
VKPGATPGPHVLHLTNQWATSFPTYFAETILGLLNIIETILAASRFILKNKIFSILPLL